MFDKYIESQNIFNKYIESQNIFYKYIESPLCAYNPNRLQPTPTGWFLAPNNIHSYKYN